MISDLDKARVIEQTWSDGAMARGLQPYGVLRMSNDYYLAALAERNARGCFSHPAYFLASHSIELSLKAFLMWKGMTSEKLAKAPYGHRLGILLARAKTHRLGRFVTWTSVQDSVVAMLAAQHGADFAHRYLKLERTIVPGWNEVRLTCHSLTDCLHDALLRHLFGRNVQRASSDALGKWPTGEGMRELMQRV